MLRSWLVRGTVAALAAAALVGFPSPAFANTYTVTSTSLCGGAGTFEQALNDANANAGLDTITFTPGLVIDASSCTTPGLRPFPFATFATESVNIVGNGARIEGNQLNMDGSGQINNAGQCPGSDPRSIFVRITFGFMQIGTYEADNSAISVSIDGLVFHNMPSLVQVEKNASLTMTDSLASDIVDFNTGCDRSAIAGGHGANVTLVRTQIYNSTMPRAMRTENGISAVVFGDGNLVLDHVKFVNNDYGRAVAWFGGTTTIQSSELINSGGLFLDADTTSIVNSAFFADAYLGAVSGRTRAPSNRIVTSRSNVSLEASTFYWTDATCDNCSKPGMGLWITNPAAAIFIKSSAIGTQSPLAGSGPLLLGYNGTGGLGNYYNSDALTWVQPTEKQDDAALGAVLPNALTTPPGLDPRGIFSLYTTGLHPLLGTVATPGVLLDAVADADCGGANALVSPIDGSCVTTDVFGSPRIDAGNNARDIGAVQTSLSPHLAVTSVTAEVGLGWNAPPDPVSGPITGYRVTWVPVAGGASDSVDVVGRDTAATTITGLTVGTSYRFTIRALNDVGPGTPSNQVEATPIGNVASPTPTATPDDTGAHVSWTQPALGGRPGPPSYFVVYRPAGATTWIVGPGPLTARTTTIPELVNGTTYEVGVFAVSTDGTPSALGTTTVTPLGPPAAPTLTVKAGAAGTGGLILTWTKPDDGGSPITGYQVQCRPTGSTSWTDHPATGLGRSLTISGLPAGTRVECQVSAANAVGTGPWSALAAATPTPSTDPGTSDPLASTGFSGWGIGLAAVVLLGAGIALVGVSRRRHRTEAK